MLTVVFTGVREVEVGDDGVVREFVPNRDTPMEQTMAVLRSEAFWRLSLFTFLLVGVRLVFRHMDATMSKVLVRSFGPSAPFGLIYSINPFLIIFLVPVVGLLTRRVDSYTMILVGATISACPRSGCRSGSRTGSRFCSWSRSRWARRFTRLACTSTR